MSKNEHTTIVGISAEGVREDWSSEFVLEYGAKPLRRMSSTGAATRLSAFGEDDPFSDADSEADSPQTPPMTIKATVMERISDITEGMAGDDDEPEDWDTELGISNEVREGQDWLADGFRLVVSETLGLGHGGILDELTAPASSENDVLPISIPNRCKIVSQLFQGHDDVNMVLYPKSIALFSLKLDGDRRQLKATELDEWLRTIVTKHITRVESAMKLKNTTWLSKIQAKEKGFSSRIVRSWSEAITIMYRLHSMELYDSLVKFAKLLRHFSRMDKGMLFQFCNLDETEYSLMFDHVLNILRIAAGVDTADILTGKYSKRGMRRANYHFRISLTDSVVASPIKGKKNSSTLQPLLFGEMIRYAVVMFPEQVEQLAVLELQAAANHSVAMLENNIESSWSPSPYSVFKAYLTLYRATAESANALASSVKRRGSNGSGAKSKHGANRHQHRDREHDKRDEAKIQKSDTTKTAIMCDMYFLLNGYNPLSVTYSQYLSAAMEVVSSEQVKGGEASGLIHEEEDDEASSDGESSAETDDYPSEESSEPVSEGVRQREMMELDTRVSNILKHFHASRNDILQDAATAPENSSDAALGKKRRSQSLSATLSSKQSRRSIQQVYDVLADEGVGFFDIFHLLYSDLDVFKNIFTSKYRSIGRKDILKAKVAFALGSIILHGGQVDPTSAMEQAESIYLEALVLLDKLYSSQADEVSPPIISPFGIMATEKFAELLIKNSKYKFGISCLESVVAAHMVVKSGEEKRLYRRLTAVAQECGDTKRSLYYHCIMLRIAKEEAKLNEFVYISDLVSKLFLEVGEVRIAERCLRVVALLLTGCPLPFVEFETVDVSKLKYHSLPIGLGIPTVDLSRSFDTGGLWAKRTSPIGANMMCDSQQLSAVNKLIDLYMVSNHYQMAIDLCLSLLKRKVVPQSRGAVLLNLAKCYLKLQQLTFCEATLDRMVHESEEIVSDVWLRSSFGVTHRREATDPIAPSPQKSVSNSRFYRSMFEMNREAVLKPQTEPSRSNPHTRLNRRANGAHGSHFHHHHFASSSGFGSVSTSAGLAQMGLVSRVRSYTYMILRAKCRLAANDPEWALYWLQIALAICPRGKYDRRGYIRYLNGKAYAKLCMRCHASEEWGVGQGEAAQQLVDREQFFASRAEEEFRLAWTLFKTYTDDIVKQTKAMSRIVELHVSRLFQEVAVEKSIPLSTALDGKAETLIRSMDGLSRMTLQLAGDTAAPFVLIRSLINCCELSFLQGNTQLAFSAWCEAKSLLLLSYLQSSSSVSISPAAPSSAEKSPSFSSASYNMSYDIPDEGSPVGDIPLPPIPFHPTMLLRIYELLGRIMRLGFVLEPCPLLSNGSALLAAWTRLNHVVESVVTPVFSTKNVLMKSLESFSRVLYQGNLSPRPSADTNSFISTQSSFHENPDREQATSIRLKHTNSLLKMLGLSADAITNKDVDSSPRIIKSKSLSDISVIKLEPVHLKAHLSRPTLLSLSRRQKTVLKYSTAFGKSVGYIMQDDEDAIDLIPVIESKQHWRTRTSQDGTSDFEHKLHSDSENESGGDDNLDESVVRIVASTANMIVPFEIMKKALSLDFGTETSSPEGVRAVNAVLKIIRESGKNALLDRDGPEVQHILARGASPGVTMTAGGFFVEGVVDYSTAEERARLYSNSHSQSLQDDLPRLLRHINSIYPETQSMSGDESKRVNNFVESYGNLVGASPSKIRLQVLFLRLKVHNSQYTNGHMTLTEYHKKNMEVLKRIVYSHGAMVSGLGSISGASPFFTPSKSYSRLDSVQQKRPERVLPPPLLSPIHELTSGSFGTSFDENEDSDEGKVAPPLLPPERMHSQTLEVRKTLTETSVSQALYPPSFRFVIFMNSSLLLFSPHSNTVAVANLRNSIRTANLTPASSRRLIVEPTNGQSNTSLTLSQSSDTEDDEFAEMIHTNSGRLVAANERRFRSHSSRSLDSDNHHFHSAALALSDPKSQSRIATLRPQFSTQDGAQSEGDENSSDYYAVINAYGGSTSPTAPMRPLSDSTIMTALSGLPIACEDILPDRSSILNNKTPQTQQPVLNSECVVEALRILGFQRVLFMLTALILEEPLLLLISPGNERILVHTCTALLRLLRPLTWQHLYIPLMHSSTHPILGAILRNHDPFLIGTYHEVVGHQGDVMAWSSMFSNMCIATNISTESQSSAASRVDIMSHRESFSNLLDDVNIIDLDTGAIKPGRRMQFAAACTLSSTGGIVPEADPSILHSLRERLEAQANGAASNLKPPIPARYRYHLYSQLMNAVPANAANVLYPPQPAGKMGIKKENLVSFGSEVESEVLQIMCSLFKGLKEFTTDISTSTKSSRRVLDQKASGVVGTTRDELGESRNALAEEAFLVFLKDDVKPFVVHLLHTRSFKRFVHDIFLYTKDTKTHGAELALRLAAPTLSHFITIVDKRMKRRQRYYYNMSSGRIAGYIITYFAKAIPEQEEQTYPFLYEFPYSPEAVRARMLETHSFHKDHLKVKRRWCVLDVQRFTYYKSRSKRLIKDHINIDPSNVRLVSAPFCHVFTHAGSAGNGGHKSDDGISTESHACALVYGSGSVIVFRAETASEQYHWVRALRARLSGAGDNDSCSVTRMSIESTVNRFCK